LTLRFEVNKRTALGYHGDYIDDVSRAEWVDPNLFAQYLSPAQAALARQLYNLLDGHFQNRHQPEPLCQQQRHFWWQYPPRYDETPTLRQFVSTTAGRGRIFQKQ
ncbi:MAG: hypothetical protein MUF62_06865, partial [Chitinophagaceae bacterium]|nr:hypothetical protein [Chitinophagaceae bacterium]